MMTTMIISMLLAVIVGEVHNSSSIAMNMGDSPKDKKRVNTNEKCRTQKLSNSHRNLIMTSTTCAMNTATKLAWMLRTVTMLNVTM